MWAPWRSTPAPAPRRLLASIGVDASLITDRGAAAILSPDGTTLVFSARQESQPRLFIRKLDQLQATPLAGTEGAVYPFFSPDGQWIGFFAGAKLKKVSVAGGAPVTLCDAHRVAAGRGSMTTRSCSVPRVERTAALLRVPADGGTPTPFGTFSQGATTQRWPQALPGGKTVLYTESASVGNFDGANVVVATVPADALGQGGPCESRRSQCVLRSLCGERAGLADARRARTRPPSLHPAGHALRGALRSGPPRDDGPGRARDPRASCRLRRRAARRWTYPGKARSRTCQAACRPTSPTPWTG